MKKLFLAKETLVQLNDQEAFRVQGAIQSGVVNGCDPSQYKGCTLWAGCPNTLQKVCTNG